MAGARQRVAGTVVAAAGLSTVGSIVAGRAGEVTAGERVRGEGGVMHPGMFPALLSQTPSTLGKAGDTVLDCTDSIPMGDCATFLLVPMFAVSESPPPPPRAAQGFATRLVALP